MVKITSKLYRPSDLLDIINTVKKAFAAHDKLEPKNLVIDLHKMGYKIVKVMDAKS